MQRLTSGHLEQPPICRHVAFSFCLMLQKCPAILRALLLTQGMSVPLLLLRNYC